LFAAENGTAQSRVGIVAGRWVGKAVVRNRVKRRLRELLRQHWSAIAPGYDLVWQVRTAAATALPAALAEAAFDLLRRARLLREPRPAPANRPTGASQATGDVD
jgi:ribonuclease P protein component